MNCLELHEYLHYFNKTQETFARDMGVSVTTVNRWLNGRNKPSQLALRRIEDVIKKYQEERLDEERQNKGAA